MTYGYYGAGLEAVRASASGYPGIVTPDDLYAALLNVWSRETCTPRLRDKWSASDPTVGQCSITAFLAQDIFGGEVYGLTLPNGDTHCYNVVAGETFDLTSEQFGDEAAALVYTGNPTIDREAAFAVQPEKRERFELLRHLLLSLERESRQRELCGETGGASVR